MNKVIRAVIRFALWLLFDRKLRGYCNWCGAGMYSASAQRFHNAAKCCAATDSMNAEYED